MGRIGVKKEPKRNPPPPGGGGGFVSRVSGADGRALRELCSPNRSCIHDFRMKPCKSRTHCGVHCMSDVETIVCA